MGNQWEEKLENQTIAEEIRFCQEQDNIKSDKVEEIAKSFAKGKLTSTQRAILADIWEEEQQIWHMNELISRDD